MVVRIKRRPKTTLRPPQTVSEALLQFIWSWPRSVQVIAVVLIGAALTGMTLWQLAPPNLRERWFYKWLANFHSPKISVISQSISPHVFQSADGPDAGVSVTYVLRNTAWAGDANLKVTLFCSDGTFYREEHVHFNEGEMQQRVYGFPEPSWAAHDYTSTMDFEPLDARGTN